MDYDLLTENKRLRAQLDGLLAEARQNEEKLRRFDELERELIGSRALSELVLKACRDYRTHFELDLVTLSLVDPEYELARMLEGQEEPAATPTFLASAEPLDAFYGPSRAPILGTYRHQHADLFNRPRITPASVALLPLVRHGQLIGSFNLGSLKADRFANDAGTAFLERLATILAICLENAANHERLKLAGLTDPLTGVSNRRYFEQRLEEEVSHALRHEEPLACMLLDVDRFKKINDTHGHPSGDLVLREVAKLIKAQVRSGDLVARYGGEEFIVLLPDTTRGNALEIAERIRAAIALHVFRLLDGNQRQVTISIGLANLRHDAPAQPGETLIAAADKALYDAKHRGRNQVVLAAEN